MSESVANRATLAHGYTMADLDKIANATSFQSISAAAGIWIDQDERKAVAWNGAVVALYEATERPTRSDLQRAAMDAVRAESRRIQKDHGSDRNNGGAEMPRFAQYWLPPRKSNVDDGFSDHLTERLALPMILGLLTDRQYEAVVALAVHGSQTEAAKAIGLTDTAFKGRLYKARLVAYAAWYSPESPPARVGRDDKTKCRYGHDLSDAIAHEEGVKPKCRTCDRNSQRRSRLNRKLGAHA